MTGQWTAAVKGFAALLLLSAMLVLSLLGFSVWIVFPILLFFFPVPLPDNTPLSRRSAIRLTVQKME